jgi:chromosome segregation ATPase
VLSLLTGLKDNVVADADAEAKAYKEYYEWCDDAVRQTGFAIKTATSKKESLEALIYKMSATADAADIKVGELAASIADDDKELKSLTAIREKEAADFAAGEKELKDVVDTLGRAINIVEKEMAKNPAALAQLDMSSLDNMVKSLATVVDAAGLPSADKRKLVTLVQQQAAGSDDDADLGAPAAAVYKTHSTGVVDVLEDLKEKAEEQLSTLQKTEGGAKHNYEMAKQALEDQMAADTKAMEAEKETKTSSLETKATAEGDLEVALKDLADSKEVLATCTSNCMTTAADHEATVAARKEELKVLAQAMSVLKSSTSGAVAQTYSLFQVVTKRGGSRMQTHADLANIEVVTLIKHLAKTQHSTALAQLASRIAAVFQYGESAGEDPFAKVKTLINGLITKLESEAGSDASEKEYCDEQTAKTEEKKGDLEFDVKKLSTKIDQATAASAKLKAEVKELQAGLAALSKLQAEMDSIRAEEHGAYTKAKADLEEGLTGVRNAISVLRDYYSGASSASMLQEDSDADAVAAQPAAPETHTKATGAASSILGLLEVVESDFAKNLASEETEEADAEEEYEKTAQDNSVTKTLKDYDVKYKTQEYKALDKRLSELSGDLDSKSTELKAVLDYYEKIKDRCIAKAESYSERAARREAEISGLKQALEVLENEVAFAQRSTRGLRRSLRARRL